MFVTQKILSPSVVHAVFSSSSSSDTVVSASVEISSTAFTGDGGAATAAAAVWLPPTARETFCSTVASCSASFCCCSVIPDGRTVLEDGGVKIFAYTSKPYKQQTSSQSLLIPNREVSSEHNSPPSLHRSQTAHMMHPHHILSAWTTMIEYHCHLDRRGERHGTSSLVAR